MLIKFHKFDDYTRDRIRLLENKGHVGYIRYLMVRRIPFNDISNELNRLGLSGVDESDYALYFESVIYPVIQEYFLTIHYKKYAKGKNVERLNFEKEFGKSETVRKNFCAFIKELEIEEFFAKEIVNFYGGAKNVPLLSDGSTIVTTEKMPDWTEMLNHPKRHIIDAMLVDGHTPKMVSNFLDQNYDEQLNDRFISAYANAFFKTRRRDLERTISDLENEREQLKEGLEALRNADESKMTIGEKTAALGTTKQRIQELDTQIKRLTSHHSSASFNASLLDYAGMREMFADVVIRTHRRYTTMDERTEDEVVGSLSTLVGMLDKASKGVLGMDEVMKENSKKSVSDEMLEIVQPSMERLEEEEERARLEYEETFKLNGDEDDEVLGLDEE